MSIKLFGEYLIEKQVINEDTLVEVLVEQMKTMPSVCEIVYQNKLLTARQILNALTLQMQKQTDFVTACRELGTWSDQIQQEVSKQLSELRIPIGQILVKTKGIKLDAMASILDSYLMDCVSQPAAPVAVPQAAEIPAPIEPLPVTSALSAAAAEAIIESALAPIAPVETAAVPPAPEVLAPSVLEPIATITPATTSIEEPISPFLLLEFGDQFNKSTYDRLSGLVDTALAEPTSGALGEMMQIASEILHRLVGAAKLTQLEGLQNLFEELEWISSSLSKSLPEATAKELATLMKQGSEIAWHYRSDLLGLPHDSHSPVQTDSKMELAQVTQAISNFRQQTSTPNRSAS